MKYTVNALPKSHPLTEILFVEILDGENRYTLSVGPDSTTHYTGREYNFSYGASGPEALVSAKSLGWDGTSLEGAREVLAAAKIQTTDLPPAQTLGQHINFPRLAAILEDTNVQFALITYAQHRGHPKFVGGVRALLENIATQAQTPIRMTNLKLQTAVLVVPPPAAA